MSIGNQRFQFKTTNIIISDKKNLSIKYLGAIEWEMERESASRLESISCGIHQQQKSYNFLQYATTRYYWNIM